MLKANHSRRNFIKFMGISGGYASLQTISHWSDFAAAATSRNAHEFYKKNGPIDYNINTSNNNYFFGDDPKSKAHPILWGKSEFLKNNKVVKSESTDLVIVGGGISGLSSAYLLRKHKPIVLEQAERFGGNSRAEVWNGISYSTGAAYFMEQEPDTEIYKLFKELNIHSHCRMRNEEDEKLLNGIFYKNFWNGEIDQKNKKQYMELAKFFKDMYDEKNGLFYPEIPLSVVQLSEDKKLSEFLKKLDGYSFREYLEKIVLKNNKLTTYIEQVLERYMWSAFSCSIDEISAAMGLNAYVAEFGGAYVAPGGNAKVAEIFYRKGLETIPKNNYRANSLVCDVKVENDLVNIKYVNSKNELHEIKSKFVVMACPKFVVKKVLQDIETERLAAYQKLKYRSYLVANALIDEKIKKDIYDTYLIGEKLLPQEAKISDVILANYAEKSIKNKTVLTLYRSFPHDEGRANLYADGAFEKFKLEIINQLKKEILPAFNYKYDNVKTLRIHRWGHPMPLPSRGLILDGTVDQLRKPFKEKVFFVEQDNWVLPSLETCIGEALFWAPKITALLS